MIQTILKTWIKEKILLTIWLLITFLCVTVLYLSPEILLLSLVSLLTKGWTEKIILVLLLISIGLMLSLLILHRKNKEKIKIQEFTFVDPPGYYTHPKYPNQKICPSCLIKTKLISPVVKDGNAWYCTVCDKPMSGSRGEAFTIPD